MRGIVEGRMSVPDLNRSCTHPTLHLCSEKQCFKVKEIREAALKEKKQCLI